ncbi:hypothetical protein SteCoe_27444 [Stentor coeruleus]|uniref:Uncharacterized protein n=1 Tax=Stentor coeruleus TaxID=5963 RepID=A0A1R2BAK4_9CILI|nr:hypothetical protein SteCoe_27444 [Stentor coeruleus]
MAQSIRFSENLPEFVEDFLKTRCKKRFHICSRIDSHKLPDQYSKSIEDIREKSKGSVNQVKLGVPSISYKEYRSIRRLKIQSRNSSSKGFNYLQKLQALSKYRVNVAKSKFPKIFEAKELFRLKKEHNIHDYIEDIDKKVKKLNELIRDIL